MSEIFIAASVNMRSIREGSSFRILPVILIAVTNRLNEFCFFTIFVMRRSPQFLVYILEVKISNKTLVTVRLIGNTH